MPRLPSPDCDANWVRTEEQWVHSLGVGLAAGAAGRKGTGADRASRLRRPFGVEPPNRSDPSRSCVYRSILCLPIVTGTYGRHRGTQRRALSARSSVLRSLSRGVVGLRAAARPPASGVPRPEVGSQPAGVEQPVIYSFRPFRGKIHPPVFQLSRSFGSGGHRPAFVPTVSDTGRFRWGRSRT